VGPVENFIKRGGEGKRKGRGGEGPRNLSGLGLPNTLIRPCDVIIELDAVRKAMNDFPVQWSCNI
jgi:hypothetical protein